MKKSCIPSDPHYTRSPFINRFTGSRYNSIEEYRIRDYPSYHEGIILQSKHKPFTMTEISPRDVSLANNAIYLYLHRHRDEHINIVLDDILEHPLE